MNRWELNNCERAPVQVCSSRPYFYFQNQYKCIYDHHLNFRKIIGYVFFSFCFCLKFPVNTVHLFNLEKQSKSFSTEVIKVQIVMK